MSLETYWLVRDDEGLYLNDHGWTDSRSRAERFVLAEAEVRRDEHRDRGAVIVNAWIERTP